MRWTKEQLDNYEQRRKKVDRGGQISSAVTEQTFQHEPLAPEQAKETDSTRFTVIVESYRRRLLDEDNLCPKFHVDALRYCGVLPSDSAKRTKIRVFQFKVKGPQDEKTIIHVIPPA